MTRMLLSATVVAGLLGGCTWVEMEPQGRVIRVAMGSEDMSACERRGEIAVSVRDRVGFVERNELKVRDELEVLARNEAAAIGADTLQAANEPADGNQRFVGYTCRGTARTAAPLTPEETAIDAGTAKTFPIQGD